MADFKQVHLKSHNKTEEKTNPCSWVVRERSLSSENRELKSQQRKHTEVCMVKGWEWWHESLFCHSDVIIACMRKGEDELSMKCEAAWLAKHWFHLFEGWKGISKRKLEEKEQKILVCNSPLTMIWWKIMWVQISVKGTTGSRYRP